jgi:hypothetical protein
MVVWGTLVTTVVWWSCRQVFAFDFVAWDDEFNILLNPHLGPPDVHNLQWMFTDVAYMRRYVPFGWLGFSVAYAFSGLSAVAYHSLGVLLHVANALLLFVTITWILRRWCPGIDEVRLPRCAAIGALFWAVHPLRAETIGWSSGILYSLACLSALVSVLAYCRAQSASSNATSRAWRWTSAGFYLLSMLTYPITLGLIVVFVAIDALEWRTRHEPGRLNQVGFRSLAWQKVPFILAAAGVTAVTLYARFTARGLWSGAPSLDEYGPIERAMRGLYTTAIYLWGTIWPYRLSPLPTQLTSFTPFGIAAISSAVLLLAITWFLWKRSPRGALALWFCYLVMLLPLLGLTEKEFYASDRYTYFPGLVGGVGVACLMTLLAGRGGAIAEIGVALLLLVFSLQCTTQLRVWENSATLFARCIELPTNARLTETTYRRWVDYHNSRGDLAAAKNVLERATREGLRRIILAELATSINLIEQEINGGLPPLWARMHAEIAIPLARQKRFREADEHFAAALRLAPQFTTARYNQALNAATSGDARRALSLLFSAMAKGPGDLTPTALRDGWHHVGNAFEAQGETTLAARARERANKVPPPTH